MPRVPTVRAADLDRVLKALAKNGQAVDAVVVRPVGGPRLLTDAEVSQALGADQ